MHCNDAEARIKSLTITTRNQPANQIRMLQSNFASLGRTIGSFFIPILQTVLPYINAVVIAIQRMFAWLAKLLGIKLSDSVSSVGSASVDMGDMADAADNAADGLDTANNNAKKLEKTLSVLSFDELNQLSDNQDTSSTSNGSSSGSSGQLPHLSALDDALDKALSDYQKAWEEAFKKMSNRANEMADAIVNAFKKKDWKGLGKIMANGINWGMQKIYDAINWNNVGPKITKFTSAFSEAFNSLVENTDFDLIGRTIGAGINTIAHTANQLLEKIDWKNLGKKFAEAVTGIVHEVEWENLGNTLGNSFMKAWKIFAGFVENLPFGEIGTSIAEAFNGIFEKVDFEEIAGALTTGINGAFESLSTFTKDFNWDEFTQNLGDGISKFLTDMDWKANGESLGNFIKHLATALTDILTPDTFRKFGEGVGKFIGGLPWGTILKTALDLLIRAFVDGLGGLFDGLSETGTAGKVASFLGKAFIAVKIADITGISTLVSNLISHIGINLLNSEAVTTLSGNLTTVLSNVAGKAATGFGELATSIGPLVGTAGLIVGVGVAAVYATKKLAGMIETMQGGNGVGGTFGNTMDNFIQTLQNRGDLISTSATEIWNLKESLEQEDMTAGEKAEATQKLIDKLGEMGVTSGQAEQAFETLRQKGLITDDMFDILSESIKTLGDESTNMAGHIDLSKQSIDDLAEVLPKLKTQLNLSADQQTALDTALYDMPNASGTAQGAYENIMSTAKEMGINTESVAKIFAETFPDAVKEMSSSTSAHIGNAAKNASDSTSKMKNDVESDLAEIQKAAETSGVGISDTTVMNWGNSASEVDKNLDQMKQHANIKLGEMQKTVESHFSSQYNTITKKWEKASERIDQIIDGMDTNISKKIPAMSKYFSQLASNITSSLSGMRDIGVNAATSLYNGMKSVQMPRLRYYISQWESHDLGNGNSSSTPIYSPNWYAKGGLFQSRSVIGIGEAGQEAVLPLENPRTMKTLADSIMADYDGGMGLSKEDIEAAVERGVVTALMNNGGMGGSMPEYIMNSIKLNEREVARLITKAQDNINSRMNPSPAY